MHVTAREVYGETVGFDVFEGLDGCVVVLEGGWETEVFRGFADYQREFDFVVDVDVGGDVDWGFGVGWGED